MKLDELLSNEASDYIVVDAYPTGPRQLSAALEVFVHAGKLSATAIVSINLDTLAAEIVYETDGETLDYAYDGGWHGLVQATRVIELVGGTAQIATTEFNDKETCSAIARMDGKTFVSGTKQSPAGKYVTDGFIAEVTDNKLVMLVETSKLEVTEGELELLDAGNGALHAAGSAMTREDSSGGRQLVVVTWKGGKAKVVPCAVRKMCGLYLAASGDVLIGSENEAAVIHGDNVRIFAVPDQVRAIAEFRGTTYWASHFHKGSKLQLWRSTANGAEPVFRGKFHWVGYRSRGGRRDLQMSASDELLVIANNDRIHVFDGARWSQLALQRDLAKLVKKVPAGMKA